MGGWPPEKPRAHPFWLRLPGGRRSDGQRLWKSITRGPGTSQCDIGDSNLLGPGRCNSCGRFRDDQRHVRLTGKDAACRHYASPCKGSRARLTWSAYSVSSSACHFRHCHSIVLSASPPKGTVTYFRTSRNTTNSTNAERERDLYTTRRSRTGIRPDRLARHRMRIPRDFDHRFHGKTIIDSSAIRSPIPRQFDH